MKIPEAALQQHIAVLGKTGSGKTFAIKGVVEHWLEAQQRVGIVDPTGAWWGLRSSRDGKGAGFPILVLGGDHGDLPLPALGGAAVARLLVEQSVNLIADTTQLTVGERTRWFTDFAGTLYRINRGPLHLVLDEAHNFAPQGKVPDPDTGKMLHAANTLASGGRSRGIRLAMITQRPQKLHKDTLTSADTLIAMRVLAPHDRGAVKDWIDGCGDPAQGKQVLDSLANMQRGEGWVWYPEGGFLEKMKFPGIRTFDSSATPTDGGSVKAPKGAAEIDLTEIRAAMADAVKEAEANDPKLLRAKIRELEKKAGPQEVVEKIVEVPVLKDSQIERLEKLAEKLMAEAAELRRLAAPAAAPRPVPRPVVRQPVQPRPDGVARPSEPVEGLNGPEQRILDAIAWLESVGNAQPEQAAVAFIAGYTIGGGAFNNPRGALRTKGLVEYVGSDRIALTDSGRALANKPDGDLTVEELQQRVLQRLPGPERKILQVLIEAYPDPMEYGALADRAGYAQGGGAFNNPRGRLRSLGLIEYPQPGFCVARPVLFLE